MANKLEQAAVSILDTLINNGGTFDQGEPGEVLRNLGNVSGVDYKTASLAVLYLEREELVAVERLDHPDPRRANRIIAISLA